MNTFRQVGGSLLLALFSVALVIGGISLALAESYVPQIPTPSGTLPPTSIFNAGTAHTNTPVQTALTLSTTPPTPSLTVPPPTNCPPPAGWIAVMVQPGESLATLAARYQTTSASLSSANCLFSSDLPAGSILYVPPVATQTTVPCGPPPGWVRYIVRSGDTLTGLSQAFGVSVSQLQFANCMPSTQFYLAVGQAIYVPNVATRFPRATATQTLTPVSINWTPSDTPTPTHTPTSTATPTSTDSPTATPTATVPPPTISPTFTATSTSIPSATATPPPSVPE